jgi:AcrR family transcriptional regulator
MDKDQGRDTVIALALEDIETRGVRALSLPGLASRTGLSRAGIYRMFSGRDDLLGQLAAREMPAMVEAAMTEVDTDVATPDLVRGMVLFALSYLRRHRALNRIRELEPDALLPLVITRADTAQTAIELIASHVAPVLADERHRRELVLPAGPAAELLVRIVLSHFLSESRCSDDASVAAAAARAVCPA